MDGDLNKEALQLLTLTEAARRSGIDRRLFYQTIDRGEIPVLRLGGRRRIEVRTLQAYVRSQLQQAQVMVSA